MNFAEIRAQILYNAILISILILYGLFGTYIFRTLETQNVASLENSQPEISRGELLKELWNPNNLGFDDWSAKATGKLDSYKKRLPLDTSSLAEWSLADSWLFACTVFTTIGTVRIFFNLTTPLFVICLIIIHFIFQFLTTPKSIFSNFSKILNILPHPPNFLYIKNIRKIIQKFSKNY